MKFNFNRILRTVSSEQYGVYTEENDLYALVDIHYAKKVDVSIILEMDPAEEIDEDNLSKLMYDLEGEVILSYTGEVTEVFYTVVVGRIEAEYSSKINRTVY